MSKKITTEEFIERAKKVHGDKYDYSLVEYKNSKTKVKIICPICGVFEQIPTDHLNGCGCPKCLGKNKTTEDFIKQVKKIHGDKYDYSLAEYVNSNTKVKIICPVHGVFEQRPYDHFKGHGCPECKNDSTGNRLRKTTEDFIENAKKVHGNKYDYSLVDYKNRKTKVKIICPVHGVFEQNPYSHLHGTGCPICSGKYQKTKEEFIKQAKEIHGDKYDYSLVEYKNCETKVKIICPVHGVFEQRPFDHLHGNSCPKCNEYKTEIDVEKILQKEKIDNITQKTFDWLIYKDKMKLDFYIPEYNVAIECQGKQHFEPVDFFDGENGYTYTIDRDNKKRELCEKHGIKVFYYANYQYDFPYKVYTDPNELIAEIKKIDPV